MNNLFFIVVAGAGLIESGTENHLFWCPADKAFRPLRYCITWGSGAFLNISDAYAEIKKSKLENAAVIGFTLQFMGQF